MRVVRKGLKEQLQNRQVELARVAEVVRDLGLIELAIIEHDKPCNVRRRSGAEVAI